MPHQCLKCGHIFENGSSQLLKGCPECNGNRFFFTKQPLTDYERKIMSNEVSRGIPSKLVDLAGEKHKDSGTWITINPKELRKILEDGKGKKEEKLELKKHTQKQESQESITEVERKAIIEKIKLEVDLSGTPETIGIEQSGKYSIDLKGLLENEPIVIQKDGTYTIHLPSVFKMIEKEK